MLVSNPAVFVSEPPVRCNMYMRTLHRSSLLTADQVKTGLFYSTRTVVASPWPDALDAFMEGMSDGGASDEEDWLNGDEDGDTPFATMGLDLD
jgi:hypothetical protein